ncbi:MAG: tetratricopeptide repeat protein, partial [Gemmatimonadota bacterium]
MAPTGAGVRVRAERTAGLKRIIHEIHRRSLWQVVGIYLAGSWVAIQVVETLTENLRLPEWFPTFALGLLVLGLPVVVATAFVQEGVGAGSRDGTERPPDPDDVGPTPSGGVARPSREVAPAAHRRLLTWRNAIAGGLAASLLWGGIALGWLLFGRGPAAEATAAAEDSGADRRSIAVLPFTNRSAAEGESAIFFAEGIHDDILTQLSKIDALKVISRTSVMQYEGQAKPIREIARELGVATVLEGGVERAGDRIRMNVQLIDAASDAHLWAETYDEALTTENIFAIRSDLARRIAGALAAELTPEDEARLEERPPENLRAYDLYAEGRYLRHKAASTTDRRAIDLFQRAIATDTAYAPPYAGLADAYLGLWRRGLVSTDEARAEVGSAVQKALELDPGLAEAHAARGQYLGELELEYEEAERAFRRAIELNPGYADAHGRLGTLLVTLNRLGAARGYLERAVELDPLSRLWRANLAFVYMFDRKPDEAEVQARRLLKLEPDFSYGHYILAFTLSEQGEHEAAIEAMERAVELEPEDLATLIGLGFVHARAGNRDRALELVAETEKRGGSLKEIALVYGALGEIDRAFEYLDRAHELDPAELN